jgi:hypothetical protein
VPLLPLRRTPQAWTVLRISYEAVPDYDLAAICEGLTEEQIRQEIMIDWTASSDRRIFPAFGEIHIAQAPLAFDPRRPLVCGWDVGLSQVPAFVPTQMNGFGQWLIFPPVVGRPEVTTGIYDFGETIALHLKREYCLPHHLAPQHLMLQHYGDPAGNARPPRSQVTSDQKVELRSAHEILYDGMDVTTGYEEGEAVIERLPGWGWRIQPGAVSLAERFEAIRARLKLLVNGRPALLVDPRAHAIVEGFQGAYHYRRRADGSYEDRPEKNWHSHPMDAIQYVATRLFASGMELADEDDARPFVEPWRSHAAGRRER